MVQQTDILAGMHGAALAHALLLPPHAALVELWPQVAVTCWGCTPGLAPSRRWCRVYGGARPACPLLPAFALPASAVRGGWPFKPEFPSTHFAPPAWVWLPGRRRMASGAATRTLRSGRGHCTGEWRIGTPLATATPLGVMSPTSMQQT